MCIRSVVLFATFLISMFSVVGVAVAAPPANDARDAAPVLAVPQSIAGTTVEATDEEGEPDDYCRGATSKNSVWYRITGIKGYIALALQAEGDLDANLAVFERSRSQTEQLDCSITDGKGFALVSFYARSGTEYLVRVAERSNSVSGNFTLRTMRASEEAELPGRSLPANGRSDTVNFVTNPSDAWSIKLRTGVTYRINLATSSSAYCVHAYLIRHDETVRRLSCRNGYLLFTPRPGEGGRYSILVEATTRRLSDQHYHLEVATAGVDDTGPGRRWNGTSIGGHLSGNGIDVSDLYHWRLTRRAIVEIRVTGDFEIELRSAGGRVLAHGGFGESIERKLSPGQYYVVVRATDEESAGYTLSRVERVITSTSVTFNGAKNATISGGSVTVTGRVSPAVGGSIEVIIERRDPVYGWQFFRKVSGSSGGGSFSTSFFTDGPGRWRAKAAFKGTRTANRSSSGYARLKVTG